MMTDAPDLDGFREAQVLLIEATAENVIFFVPEPTEWPDGTALDPQTQRPYDITIQPESSGFASAAVPCNVVSKPVGNLEGEVNETAFGNIREGEIACLIPLKHMPLASGATEAEWHGVRYHVNDFKPDGLQEIERYIAFLEEINL